METLPVAFNYFWLPLLLSLPVLILLLRFSLQGKFQKRLSPSGPASYPLIGSLLSFYENRYRLLDWYTEMLALSPSQTITISRFGARRTIVTANPRNVEYMLKTNFSNFPKGKPFTELLSDFLGKGIFNVDGDLWYDQRKLTVHQFNARSLRGYVDNILKEEVEKKLLPLLETAAKNNLPIDLQDILRRFAFDVVCRFSLQYDPGCLDYKSLDTPHPVVVAFDVASNACAMRGAAPLPVVWKLKRFFNIGPEKKLREAVARIHQFVNEILIRQKERMVERKKQGIDEEMDLLSKMVMEGKDEAVIRDTIISIIMAGRDTTSSAMTWLFYLLSLHPEVENEALKELELVRGNQGITEYEALKEMTWLKACICESMRLFPPVAWDSKHAAADDVLPDGTPVREGDRVTYFPYGMGRMAGLWGEDCLEFKPERWVEGSWSVNVWPYKFPVFQAGPRVCLGKEMAFIQMKYVVGSIMQRFILTPVEPARRAVFVPLLTAHMAGGFKVYVTPRK